jgi:hypothetical protein
MQKYEKRCVENEYFLIKYFLIWSHFLEPEGLTR